MKARSIIAILAVLAVMYFFFKRDRQEAMKMGDTAQEETSEPQKAARTNTDKKSEEVIKNQLIETQALKEKATAPPTSPEQVEEVQKNFSNQLRQMGQCLAVQIRTDQEKIDPQYDNLANTVSSGFGNMLVKMDDWTQWEGQASDGSIKRIRTEIEYLENNIPTKRVQLYKLNQQGMPEMQPLNEDEALNPPDEYLNSLRGDAKTIVDEKATRGYYAEGEELVVVERNGKIQSFSMSKGEKTFSCTETDTTASHCQCL
jgi:hypothetical protein